MQPADRKVVGLPPPLLLTLSLITATHHTLPPHTITLSLITAMHHTLPPHTITLSLITATHHTLPPHTITQSLISAMEHIRHSQAPSSHYHYRRGRYGPVLTTPSRPTIIFISPIPQPNCPLPKLTLLTSKTASCASWPPCACSCAPPQRPQAPRHRP